MIEYLKVGLALWATKFLVALAIFLLIVLVGVLAGLWTVFKQWRCLHANKFENMQCDYICRDCGKNLGFVGSYEKRKRKVEYDA